MRFFLFLIKKVKNKLYNLYERNDFTMTEAAKEARRAYQRQWRKDHRISIREYQRNWRKQNPMRLMEYQERYWAKKAFEKSFDRLCRALVEKIKSVLIKKYNR